MQTSGISVMQHGEIVWARLQELLNFLEGQELQGQWRFPSWLLEFKQEIRNKLLSKEILKQYTIYHDCGKPFCRIVDADGKQHFPEHAQKSHDVYLECAAADG